MRWALNETLTRIVKAAPAGSSGTVWGRGGLPGKQGSQWFAVLTPDESFVCL